MESQKIFQKIALAHYEQLFRFLFYDILPISKQFTTMK